MYSIGAKKSISIVQELLVDYMPSCDCLPLKKIKCVSDLVLFSTESENNYVKHVN